MKVKILLASASITFIVMFTTASVNPQFTDPSPCLAPSSFGSAMLESYQWADTTTDTGMIGWRQSIGLPAISVSQIVMVSDSTICRRAINAFNSLLTAHTPATTSVNVVKYGITRFVIGDPDYVDGEWRPELVVDSSFQKVAIAGR